MVKEVIKQLFAIIAVLWMIIGGAILFCATTYPWTALIMNSVSLIGIAVCNAYFTKGIHNA